MATPQAVAPNAAKPSPPTWSVDEIRAKVTSCTACRLHEGCLGRVQALGPAQARLLIVVDGPGAAGVDAGMPLVGAEAQVLAKALAAAGLRLDEAYVAPIVRCAPGARAGEAAPVGVAELGACARYLAAEMSTIRPVVMWILGADAARFLLRRAPDATVPSMRQQWHGVRGVDTIVSWSMRDLAEDPARKRDTWADLQEIQRRLRRP